VQQGVNMLVHRHRGLVNGYIVALYPIGAMIATPPSMPATKPSAVRTTLAGLAVGAGGERHGGGAGCRLSGARLVLAQRQCRARPQKSGRFPELSGHVLPRASAA